MPYDLDPLIDDIAATVARHSLSSPGAYSRWTFSPPDKPGGEGTGLNPYGCADAANLLYTIGQFPRDPDERAGWITTLQGMQDPETGLFHEDTHHDFHCTAHCIAALELFDARPLHPLTAMHPLLEPERLYEWLDALPWVTRPWPGSHQPAGLYAALTITGEATPDWEDAFFGWLWEETDPDSGFWRKDCVPPKGPSDTAPLFHHLAGSFHYLFCHEAAHRPLRFPERMIDTTLAIWDRNLHPGLGERIGFAEIDWVYCLTRALRQSGHRFADCRAGLQAMAARLITFLERLDRAQDRAWDDLHLLFGTACALAELQAALPGEIRTSRPLKLVLDRRPFI